MDPNTQRLLLGAAGAGEKVYVEDVFSTYLYAGNASITQTIANGIDLASKGGLVWTKSRSAAYDHFLKDTERGFSATLKSNTVDASAGTAGGSFLSTGYEQTNGNNSTNATGVTYASWTFRKAEKFFDVVTYTGTGTTLNIDCGFTAGARFVLIKRTDSTGDWFVWDTARGIVSGNDSYLLLNSTAAEVTNTDYIDPLSSGFQISSTAPAAINASGGSYIFLAIA